MGGGVAQQSWEKSALGEQVSPEGFYGSAVWGWAGGGRGIHSLQSFI